MKSAHEKTYLRLLGGVLVSSMSMTPSLAAAQAVGEAGDEDQTRDEAQDRAPTERDYEIADETALEGNKAYLAKDYARAINLYVAAYKYVPAALFLASAARAAHDSGALTQAKRLTERALAVTDEQWALDEEGRRTYEELLATIEAEIAVELAKTGEWSWVGYAGAGIAALGAVSVAGTFVTAAGVDARRDELASAQYRSEYDPLYEELSGQQRLAQTLLYSGVGLLVVGGGLIGWDLLTPGGVPYEKPTIALELGPERSSVQVGWRW